MPGRKTLKNFSSCADQDWNIVPPKYELEVSVQPNYFVFMLHYFITIILPVVLYGCKTWSLTLTEEYRRRVFKYRVLRKIFGPKGDGKQATFMTCTLQIKRNEMCGACVIYGRQNRCIQGSGGET